MVRIVLAAVVMLIAGCGTDAEPPHPDGAVVISPPPPRPDGGTGPVDFFGEACTAEPYPVNTICHAGAGWCIVGTCRPQCGPDVVRCREGVQHFAPAGACYCTPD
jgi:hypothetical protein